MPSRLLAVSKGINAAREGGAVHRATRSGMSSGSSWVRSRSPRRRASTLPQRTRRTRPSLGPAVRRSFPPSISPEPAVASVGGAFELTMARPSGAAITVSAPFEHDHGAALRRRSRGRAPSCRLLTSKRRANSPSSGVSTQGTADRHRTGPRRNPANTPPTASASSSTGRPRRQHREGCVRGSSRRCGHPVRCPKALKRASASRRLEVPRLRDWAHHDAPERSRIHGKRTRGGPQCRPRPAPRARRPRRHARGAGGRVAAPEQRMSTRVLVAGELDPRQPSRPEPPIVLRYVATSISIEPRRRACRWRRRIVSPHRAAPRQQQGRASCE